MSSFLQIITFIVSFIFGIGFYFLTVINFKLIENFNIHLQHFLTLIYTLDMTIIYIIILYHINKGYFHIYFIFSVFIGFLMGYILDKKIVSKIHVKKHFHN